MAGALSWQVNHHNKISGFCFRRGDGTGLPGSPLWVSRVSLSLLLSSHLDLNSRQNHLTRVYVIISCCLFKIGSKSKYLGQATKNRFLLRCILNSCTAPTTENRLLLHQSTNAAKVFTNFTAKQISWNGIRQHGMAKSTTNMFG
ncbi:unnamed protein product [Cuscuta epithymum]|uniref:Uncharacterized protein n=1 Tax=Cuscuta epithymum TaxID=186058 RepID=A0AAV0C5X0_9ASTE|nr:unnamed protein product [Cuscuta epithymum]